MLIGVIADDITGASDIANTLAKGYGVSPALRVVQYLGIPQRPADAGVEAGVVSLKSRSVPAQDAVVQSLDALAWLLDQGCQQIVFKYCSTFDSTPDGNIGPVAQALSGRLGVRGVVVCPAFPAMGRTLYQGHLFVHDRLLSESGMENHPLTPMTDPDIRRWLGRQVSGPVGLVDTATVRQGVDAIRSALAATEATLAIVDATEDDDLMQIGRALAGVPLLTGGSGIAIGLAQNFAAAGTTAAHHAANTRPAAILAGSCSGMTRTQIGTHLQTHPGFEIDVDAVMQGRVAADHIIDFVLDHGAATPLAYSSGTPESVRAAQDRHGRENVAARLDALFGEVALRLIRQGIGRLVVAGGETSGAVASALGLEALEIGTELAPGVPILHGPDGLSLALKSGNFGAPDFFAHAVRTMGAGA